jgi:dUTP pyrophosphatase
MIKYITQEFPLERKTPYSIGFDLHAYLPDGSVTVRRNEIHMIHTGICIYMSPHQYQEAQIRLRSSMGLKGLIIPNAPGTVDLDYSGELKIILSNSGLHPVQINHGDRIAQLVPTSYIPTKELSSLEVTTGEFTDEHFRNYGNFRGSNGFGSTGK